MVGLNFDKLALPEKLKFKIELNIHPSRYEMGKPELLDTIR